MRILLRSSSLVVGGLHVRDPIPQRRRLLDDWEAGRQEVARGNAGKARSKATQVCRSLRPSAPCEADDPTNIGLVPEVEEWLEPGNPIAGQWPRSSTCRTHDGSGAFGLHVSAAATVWELAEKQIAVPGRDSLILVWSR